MMTLPVRSGMSLTPHFGFGGKDCSKVDSAPPICSSGDDRYEGKREGGTHEKGSSVSVEYNTWGWRSAQPQAPNFDDTRL